MLQYTSSDDAELETLPVINGDGSVVVMVANHAVSASTDDNGPGVARTVQVDVSALGTFSSGTFGDDRQEYEREQRARGDIGYSGSSDHDLSRRIQCGISDAEAVKQVTARLGRSAAQRTLETRRATAYLCPE